MPNLTVVWLIVTLLANVQGVSAFPSTVDVLEIIPASVSAFVLVENPTGELEFRRRRGRLLGYAQRGSKNSWKCGLFRTVGRANVCADVRERDGLFTFERLPHQIGGVVHSFPVITACSAGDRI